MGEQTSSNVDFTTILQRLEEKFWVNDSVPSWGTEVGRANFGDRLDALSSLEVNPLFGLCIGVELGHFDKSQVIKVVRCGDLVRTEEEFQNGLEILTPHVEYSIAELSALLGLDDRLQALRSALQSSRATRRAAT